MERVSLILGSAQKFPYGQNRACLPHSQMNHPVPHPIPDSLPQVLAHSIADTAGGSQVLHIPVICMGVLAKSEDALDAIGKTGGNPNITIPETGQTPFHIAGLAYACRPVQLLSTVEVRACSCQLNSRH